MGWSGQEDGMDVMKEIIQKEIQSISSLEERVIFKNLMEGVFLSLYDTNREMYEGLERRIKEELDYDKNRYYVKTGIVEREFFDASHHLLSPMDESDLAEKLYDMKEILRAVEEEGAFRLMKVMLRCDFLEQQKLLALQPVFEGVIDMIVTGLPEGITGKEKIRRVTIQFGEYSSMIQEDVIPVWNIQRLELDSIGFPIPCGDHQNYEHSVSLKKHGINHAYLVEDDRNVQSVSQEGERLRIVCKTGEAKKWGIYQIRSSQEQKIDRYTFPIMGNGREESFAEKYQRKWNQQIRTKTELAHFIKGFGLEDYVRYQDCQVEDDFPGNRETYAVNCFIPDEIRLRSTQKKLVLYFQPGKQERWLQRDILSFLVSEVQRIYPEYDCGGILV